MRLDLPYSILRSVIVRITTGGSMDRRFWLGRAGGWNYWIGDFDWEGQAFRVGLKLLDRINWLLLAGRGGWNYLPGWVNLLDRRGLLILAFLPLSLAELTKLSSEVVPLSRMDHTCFLLQIGPPRVRPYHALCKYTPNAFSWWAKESSGGIEGDLFAVTSLTHLTNFLDGIK